jgi:hypothetical protein
VTDGFRDHLPQVDGGLFLTDGGLETTLIFHQGIDLPAFAAFDLLKDDEGKETLRRYYAVRGPAVEAAEPEHSGWLLRHGRPSRGADLPRVAQSHRHLVVARAVRREEDLSSL